MKRILVITLPIATIILMVASHFMRQVGEELMPSLNAAMSSPAGDQNASFRMASDWADVMNGDYVRAALWGFTGVGLAVGWVGIVGWSIYHRYWRVRPLPPVGGFDVL